MLLHGKNTSHRIGGVDILAMAMRTVFKDHVENATDYVSKNDETNLKETTNGEQKPQTQDRS